VKIALRRKPVAETVGLLQDLFPGSSHVLFVGLPGDAPDEPIWRFAKTNRFTIVTADADFLRLADQNGSPPRIIRLERMDYSTEIAAELIRRHAIAIAEFENSVHSRRPPKSADLTDFPEYNLRSVTGFELPAWGGHSDFWISHLLESITYRD
jgi:predicted nuclease of predicted toxin-antitoxin system